MDISTPLGRQGVATGRIAFKATEVSVTSGSFVTGCDLCSSLGATKSAYRSVSLAGRAANQRRSSRRFRLCGTTLPRTMARFERNDLRGKRLEPSWARARVASLSCGGRGGGVGEERTSVLSLRGDGVDVLTEITGQ